MLHRNVGIQLSTDAESCLRKTGRAAMPLRRPQNSLFHFAFWTMHFQLRRKTNKMYKLIFGLIYYCSITPTCFGPLVEAIISEFKKP